MGELIGYIHSIETFGTVDGPGIRCVVFFQGCPLSCLYCHNPDTRASNMGARKYTPHELAHEAAKYKHYFKASGGGVTASGGEPTFQAEFLREFFKECKLQGIHTALDTSGFVDLNAAEKIIEFTDLVILDIKHLESSKCKELTGKSNTEAFEFLRLLSQKSIPVIIRQVLVEGWTDSEEYINSLIDFLKDYSCVQKVEVLPFHKMGEEKWEKLGMKAPLSHIPPFPQEKADKIQSMINEKLQLHILS